MLIVGAGGVVGKYTIALAMRAGAYVIATGRPRSADAVRTTGADDIIDRTETDVLDAFTDRFDHLLTWPQSSRGDFTALARLVPDGGHGERHRLNGGTG